MHVFIYGENLRKTREIQKLTQEKIANLLDISQAMYSRIERQATVSDTALIGEIARLTGVLPYEKITVYEEIDPQTLRATYGAGFKRKIAVFWSSPTGKFALLVLAGTFVNMIFLATQGFLRGLGLTVNIAIIASWAAVFATVWMMYYWGKGRKSPTLDPSPVGRS